MSYTGPLTSNSGDRLVLLDQGVEGHGDEDEGHRHTHSHHDGDVMFLQHWKPRRRRLYSGGGKRWNETRESVQLFSLLMVIIIV